LPLLGVAYSEICYAAATIYLTRSFVISFS